MKLKSVGNMSIKEALKRLIDGEVFYLGDKPIWVDMSRLMDVTKDSCVGSCFRSGIYPQDSEVVREFSNLSRWKQKVEWYESLESSGPVLCYIWDELTKPKYPYAQWITAYAKGSPHPFRTLSGAKWANALPVNSEDL